MPAIVTESKSTAASPRAKRQNAAKAKATPATRLNTLVVCADDQLVQTLTRALGQLDVEATVVTDMEKIQESLDSSKFYAVVVDFKDMDLACEVLPLARKTKLNAKAALIGIVDDDMRHRAAYDLGANFTIPRVATVNQAMRYLRSSYCMMVRERRISTRYPSDIPASGQANNGPVGLRILNLSETGIGFESAVGLTEGDLFCVEFVLPGTNKSVKITARVIWKNDQNMAGATFVQFDGKTKKDLHDWFNASLVDRFLP